MRKLLPVLAFFATLFLFSCESDFKYYYYSKEETELLDQYLNMPEIPDEYIVSLPQHLSNAGLFAAPIDRDKAVLGRVLFYDKKLSKDGKISCGSCHKQEIGFSDDRKVSLGVEERAGTRNSIALASVASFVAYYGTDLNGPLGVPFFWDNRAATASEQNIASLNNPLEMDMHNQDIVFAVQSQPYYEPLFKKAFGNDDYTVTQARVQEAIAEFVNAMGSYRSKFDTEASKIGFINNINNLNFSGFTASENRGMSLYQTNCSSCHTSNQGRPVKFKASNGLDLNPSDKGVGDISNNSGDDGLFKVPTLRNIALSAPYMHDGRFNTLDEVLNFYSSGIQNHANLDPLLKAGNGTPKRMNFSTTDKADLIAFLNTLTDDEFRADPKFSDPFK
jgi:cytochrome c peroxidase